VSQPKIAKKSIKPPILAFKVTEFGANREPVYNFLLVINSNLGRNSVIILKMNRKQLISAVVILASTEADTLMLTC